ncbi:TonB-dependent receptor [Spirosoma harenae]
MKRTITLFSFWLLTTLVVANGLPKFRRISGYVFEQGSQTPLVGVNVHTSDNKAGIITDSKGYFSLSIPASANVQLTFSFVGFTSVNQTVKPTQTNELTVYLSAGQMLQEQVVKVTNRPNISANPQMSTISLSMEKLDKMPMLFGEKDVMKMLQLMPGVQKGSEGNAGLYVRGGAPDQNLVLLDNAPIYNPNHLLGIFSAFNGDALKRVDLTKGGFPARFGGRLSSVIELTTKDGSTDGFHGEVSGGLIASRVSLSAPLGKRVSFMVAGRRTYIDMITGLLEKKAADQPTLKTYFYDANAKLTIQASDNDKIYISGYASRDKFSNNRSNSIPLQSDLQWANQAGSVRWSHVGSKGSSSNLSLLYSSYKLGVKDQQAVNNNNQVSAYTLNYQSSIQDLGLKYDFNKYINTHHQLAFGVQTTGHQFNPQAYVTSSHEEGTTTDQTVNALESGAYFEHTWSPSDRFTLNTGIRVSGYSVLKSDSLSKSSDSASTMYVRPEPRLSMVYHATPTLSFKASYALMNQYMHLLSSSGVGLSADLWVPTVGNIKPQQSQQVAFGIAKDFTKAGMSLTVEGYYKKMNQLLSYKEGASFLSTDAAGNVNSTGWTNNVTNGQGHSYGAEVLLQKQAGRLSGWIGYTLSWTEWQFNDLNGGKPFFPRYDRRHDASIVAMYDLTPSISFSASWVYGTGNALTLPIARYSGYSDQGPVSSTAPNIKEYGDRNSFRAEAYHRLNMSVRFTKKRSSFERIWEVGVYNAYNRHNAFLYSLEGKDQGQGLPSKTVLYKYSLFPVLPSVSYTVRF